MSLLREIKDKKERLAQAKKRGDGVMEKLWTQVAEKLEEQLRKRMGK